MHSSLPILEHQATIINAIKAHQVIIVAGETGSGKTTQLPKFCLKAGLTNRGIIGCTQPRRLAALSISQRIASELEVPWGTIVGCKTRFHNNLSRETVIKVMTDGILLTEIRHDPKLKQYSAIIIDEAHERSLNIDFILGYLRRLRKERTDLKIIITSATIDTHLFSKSFDGAPVFEISGRTYPVEIKYCPIGSDEAEDSSNPDNDERFTVPYVEAAIRTVRKILDSSNEGDILVFMPSERDIRDTLQRLRGDYSIIAKSKNIILPLYGNLSKNEQEAIFQNTQLRKVIIATNIAETSITIPNVKYVVDTGLARTSRYVPRSRTKKLPIERVAQSSANQRAGRAGRVKEGICIRLYSEEDFLARAPFADPEINRANLAEVILLMKAYNIGAIEDFPFLEPPNSRSIRAGLQLLSELGALNSDKSLTPLGLKLANLPVDPTIGRMLIQAEKEQAIADCLVIAAGLSIPDPRERPIEQQEKAAQAHRELQHNSSDFLTLLIIWNEAQKARESAKNLSSLRKFCKSKFLSFQRMREWIDIHEELTKIMIFKKHRNASLIINNASTSVSNGRSITRFDGQYRAIHRAILSGFIAQIAFRIQQNVYRGLAGRTLTLIKGSALYETRKHLKLNEVNNRKRHKKRKNIWIVAGDTIETDRLYAKLTAEVLPSWIEDLGQHLLRRSVSDPNWDDCKKAVTATEQVIIFGLPLQKRPIFYSKIDATKAKDLLIRSLLIIEQESLESLPFVQKNLLLCEQVSNKLAITRRYSSYFILERLINFYHSILPAISSLRELEGLLRRANEDWNSKLLAKIEDLTEEDLNISPSTEFPNKIIIDNYECPIFYRYEANSERDGITIKIPYHLAMHIPPRMLDGIVPGIRYEQVLSLLRLLPKEYRTQLHPIRETAEIIAKESLSSNLPLIEAINHLVELRLGNKINSDSITFERLPTHLQPRIEVIDDDGRSLLFAGRNLSNFQKLQSEDTPATLKQTAWDKLRNEWEVTIEKIDDIPHIPTEIEVLSIGSLSTFCFVALVLEGKYIKLKLVDEQKIAYDLSQEGCKLLLMKTLHREIKDLEKQVKSTTQHLLPLIAFWISKEDLLSSLTDQALMQVINVPSEYPPTKEVLYRAFYEAKGKISNIMGSLVTVANTILTLRKNVIEKKYNNPIIQRELDNLVPQNVFSTTPPNALLEIPRYLKALIVRSERARLDLGKDRKKEEQIIPFTNKFTSLANWSRSHPLFWLLEEYKVAIFAPELGTKQSISAKRLQLALDNYLNA
jgi:ATP-dependent helicase HrpA